MCITNAPHARPLLRGVRGVLTLGKQSADWPSLTTNYLNSGYQTSLSSSKRTIQLSHQRGATSNFEPYPFLNIR